MVQMGAQLRQELQVRQILEMAVVEVVEVREQVVQERMAVRELSFSNTRHRPNTSQDDHRTLSQEAPGQLRQDRPRIGPRGGASACGQL